RDPHRLLPERQGRARRVQAAAREPEGRRLLPVARRRAHGRHVGPRPVQDHVELPPVRRVGRPTRQRRAQPQVRGQGPKGPRLLAQGRLGLVGVQRQGRRAHPRVQGELPRDRRHARHEARRPHARHRFLPGRDGRAAHEGVDGLDQGEGRARPREGPALRRAARQGRCPPHREDRGPAHAAQDGRQDQEGADPGHPAPVDPQAGARSWSAPQAGLLPRRPRRHRRRDGQRPALGKGRRRRHPVGLHRRRFRRPFHGRHDARRPLLDLPRRHRYALVRPQPHQPAILDGPGRSSSCAAGARQPQRQVPPGHDAGRAQHPSGARPPCRRLPPGCRRRRRLEPARSWSRSRRHERQRPDHAQPSRRVAGHVIPRRRDGRSRPGPGPALGGAAAAATDAAAAPRADARHPRRRRRWRRSSRPWGVRAPAVRSRRARTRRTPAAAASAAAATTAAGVCAGAARWRRRRDPAALVAPEPGPGDSWSRRCARWRSRRQGRCSEGWSGSSGWAGDDGLSTSEIPDERGGLSAFSSYRALLSL
ncbi:uncharacterized protein RHOBADRAFT_49514, partial [Rhodotorula graminis WP1]